MHHPHRVGARAQKHRRKRAGGPSSKNSSNSHHHSTRHKNEVSPKQINQIYGQNKVGKQLENGQRKCKATTSDEQTPRDHHGTQAIWRVTAKTCGVDHAPTHRPLPPERISTPLQHHRNPPNVNAEQKKKQWITTC